MLSQLFQNHTAIFVCTSDEKKIFPTYTDVLNTMSQKTPADGLHSRKYIIYLFRSKNMIEVVEHPVTGQIQVDDKIVIYV